MNNEHNKLRLKTALHVSAEPPLWQIPCRHCLHLVGKNRSGEEPAGYCSTPKRSKPRKTSGFHCGLLCVVYFLRRHLLLERTWTLSSSKSQTHKTTPNSLGILQFSEICNTDVASLGKVRLYPHNSTDCSLGLYTRSYVRTMLCFK